MTRLSTARAFFEACDYGKVWKDWQAYCHEDASFETDSETLDGVDSLDIYCDWMTEASAMFDDNVEVEVKAEAYDRDKDIVLIYAEIRGNVIIVPEPMFMKTDYVYAIHFDGEKISHIAKVWELKLPS